ncbi:peptide-methionine (S)-S-oxide reductase MsrA [Zooshikella ganghwensis]|uniref:Peptide methionine sulfoxide reductase MsrA n=1 Tax=Zooshikella ganghwensis TaxID=202772 RepID=A0A4P9VQ50_9GAMM|nr:peptide-methionine (S)-S-oxide reductase MsrA [Zooshikella ganghwensis]RDH44667.1 peptide-methionine (S)-S-oxide reductase MsrA [Zooshikella ganghwensis]
MNKNKLLSAQETIPDRTMSIEVAKTHAVNGNEMMDPFPDGLATAMFGLGCFWGAEKRFWSVPGVYSTQVGYAGGVTKHPTYQDVCTGLTNHAEVVRIIYDPKQVDYKMLLQIFWESHDPTQGMRQGNDSGTQYRSIILVYSNEQRHAAYESLQHFQQRLSDAGYGQITTTIEDAPPFYYAEDYHQQYLAKNPGGYCGLGGTGITCGD